MIVIYLINILFLILIGGLTSYLFILSIIALRYKQNKINRIKNHYKFAFVIPAHNEELSIARTIKSALKIDYPKELWDLFVIADNCTDATEEISKNLGANVIIRRNPEQRGKGYALRYCFDLLLSNEKKYDAMVVVDADSIVQKNILQVLNHYLDKGSQAIQVADLVEPQYDSWSSEVTRIGFTLYNFVRPLGRKYFNFSAGLKGNGMCLSTDLLRKIPWSAWSLNEDLEFGLTLLLNEIVVDFAPETLVLAAMPKNPKNAETQRSRWERGRFPVIKNYTSKLFKAFLNKKSLVYLDALIELITPPIVNLFGFIILILTINVLLLLFGLVNTFTFIYIWTIILLIGLLHILTGLKAAKADKMLYKAFLHIPKYIIWKFYLYLIVFIKKFKNDWIRTSREIY